MGYEGTFKNVAAVSKKIELLVSCHHADSLYMKYVVPIRLKIESSITLPKEIQSEIGHRFVIDGFKISPEISDKVMGV